MVETDFLNFICECPADDTARLVYADWLEEKGNTVRAEFIRLDCERSRYRKEWFWLENMPVTQWVGDKDTGDLLRQLEPKVKRHTEICFKFVKECRKWSREFAKGVFGDDWLRESASWYWGWTRGFVTEVHCGIHSFLKYAKSLFSKNPIDKVVIYSSIRGLTVFRGNGEGDLPKEIFFLLQRGHLIKDAPYAGTHRCYLSDPDAVARTDDVEQSKVAANLALWDVSQACVRWARKEAGLTDQSTDSR